MENMQHNIKGKKKKMVSQHNYGSRLHRKKSGEVNDPRGEGVSDPRGEGVNDPRGGVKVSD